jgi:hypothetical protein
MCTRRYEVSDGRQEPITPQRQPDPQRRPPTGCSAGGRAPHEEVGAQRPDQEAGQSVSNARSATVRQAGPLRPSALTG